MAYGAYNDMLKRYKQFQKDSYDKAVIVTELESQGNLMLIKLRKLFDSLPEAAVGSITATGNPGEGDILSAGGIAYTFKAVPVNPFDIDIGSDMTESMLNLHSAMNEADTGSYYENTTINDKIGSSRNGHILSLTARTCGAGGNDLSLSTTSGILTLVPFSGGINAVPLLTSLNIWLTVMSFLTGLSTSNVSGSSQTPLMDRIGKQIDLAWTTLEKAGGLITEENNVLNASSMCPIKDPIVRAVDMCDPAGWHIDPNNAVQR